MRYTILTAALLGLTCVAATGCAVGYTVDGRPGVVVPMGNPDPESIAAARDAGAKAGGVIGGIVGGPGGAAVGSVIGDLVGYGLGAFGIGAWAMRRGERKGWDEAVGTPAGAKQAAEAVVPAAGVKA